jgi:hypothetical protein
VSTPNLFWFHCGRCGSLFQSPAGDIGNRLCTACGADPGLGLLEPPPEAVKPAEGATLLPELRSEHSGHGTKRGGKKRGSRFFMLKLCGGWLLLLALIVVGARHLWNQEESTSKPATPAASKAAPALTNEDVALLNDDLQKCAETISGFLAAGTPEARNQFVLRPVATATRMARFDSLSPLTEIDPGTISLTGRGVLNLPGGKAIETCWNSTDGKKIDAVFREENGEWRLDWDHFARYGDYPWSLFLAGSGPDEGEFRLLARERLADARKKADTISIVLYAPRFARPGETGFQSSEFLVPRNTRDGQLLDAAFKLARGGGQVFDSQLPNTNPEGMIRVRVKVRRLEVDRERKFEISAVLACHWYAVDDPGVVPVPPAEADAKPAAGSD